MFGFCFCDLDLGVLDLGVMMFWKAGQAQMQGHFTPDSTPYREGACAQHVTKKGQAPNMVQTYYAHLRALSITLTITCERLLL